MLSDAILGICKKQEVDAVFPGYGFLSESADFARRVHEAGMVFVGPDSDAIHKMGLKHVARELATSSGIPVIKGSGLLQDAEETISLTQELGFPVSIAYLYHQFYIFRISVLYSSYLLYLADLGTLGNAESFWRRRRHGPTRMLDRR